MRLHLLSVALLAGLLAGCNCYPVVPDNDGGTGGNGGGQQAGGTGGGDGGGGGQATGGGGGNVSEDGGIPCNAPRTCADYATAAGGANCGPVSNGCGDLIDCGSCTLPETCGGGGERSRCGGNTGCIPKTCSELNYDCGPQSDQCGGLLNCGSCLLPEICGGGGVPGICGLRGGNINDAGMCIPTSCAQTGAECGTIGDGCGGVLNCGSCPGVSVCGGGGIPYVCGGGSTCVPQTCQDVGATCGLVGDGCGATLDCSLPGNGGAACVAPQTCGGGGVPNQCGGGVTCTPQSQAMACAGKCGVVGNGCGGTYNCGDACVAPQACGGGGVPNVCGGQVVCVPTTCSAQGKNCGTIGDGCGGTLNCGSTCPGGQMCGAGGTPNVCGACVPKTCSDLSKNCGQVADGCGGLTANCGTCSGIDICGGAGTPNVCGSVVPDAGTACPLCQAQGGANTRISGVVRAPTNAAAGYGNPDPIPNALVYIPTDALESLDGNGQVTCDRCTDSVSGNPLVSTNTALNGSFTLTNTPCGIDVPLVIQLGKWRRHITIPAPACNATTNLAAEQTRLPREQGEFGNPNNNIPRIAVVTGSVDAIECVLPKIGIAMNQFSLPSGNGRVKFYRDNGAAFTGGTTANYGASLLFDNLNEMRKYDMIILDCVASEQRKTIQQRNNLEAYANAGGRVFASHFAYVWLYGSARSGNTNVTHNISFTSTATWSPNQSSPYNQDARVDTSFPKGQTFAEWIHLPEVNAQATTSTVADPRIRINVVRHDMSAVNGALAQRWVHGDARNGTSNIPFQYTFNTPTTAPVQNQCGRVLFSDFHISNASSGNSTWPNHCSASPMSPQEKVFEYLIFDLSSCIAPDVPPPQSCTPLTCAQLAGTCGVQSTGCAAPDPTTVNCACPGGQSCQNGACCVPRTCQQAGANCGTISDNCGGTLNCGTCSSPQTCGGGGTPNVCGGGACVPLTCGTLGYNCGSWGDGCGGTLNCGTCGAGQTCGGAGVAGQCGGGTCTALSCSAQGFNCGQQGNGCGGTQNCGTCPAGQVCGVGAPPGQCGTPPMCTAQTCLQQNFECGMQGDGCGNAIDCGQCPPGQICGGDGPGQCGAAQCTPLTCMGQGLSCGAAGDGCGNIIQCGACPAGQTCGGGGVPGQCGTPACTPLSCDDQNFNCGLAGDGCGGTVDCGVCPPTQTCGGGGTPNVCGNIG